MYNIHSHYQNLYTLSNNILADTMLQYLHPFGTSNIENLEVLNDNKFGTDGGPVLLCYDQEPLLPGFNDKLFEYVKTNEGRNKRPVILLNTELNSDAKNYFLEKYNFIDCYYFFHIFAAHDWYRGYRYAADLIPVKDRVLKKKYITFNRLTSSARIYRSLFINELIKHDILDQGHVSYGDVCPNNGHNYVRNLADARDDGLITHDMFLEAAGNIAVALETGPLRIDYLTRPAIPNGSMQLSAVPESQESFLQVVTETCYWDRKCHLTEKIFKPIIGRQPFVLLGCANNLAYFKSYGFKTFDRWWDESYDRIEDPIGRLQSVGNIVKQISDYSLDDLTTMLHEMQEVLDYNYNLFYSQDFLDNAWNELCNNLTKAMVRSTFANRSF